MTEMSPYHKQIAIGFSLSVGIHLYALGMWALIDSGVLPSPRLFLEWRTPKTLETAKLPDFQAKTEPKPEDLARLVFVETDPSSGKIETPSKAKYYSSRSSRAANPDPDPLKSGDDPKLDGKEKRMIATENVILQKSNTRSEEVKAEQEQQAASLPPPLKTIAAKPLPKEGITAEKPKTEELALRESKDIGLRPVKIDEARSEVKQVESKQNAASVQPAKPSPRRLPARVAEQPDTSAQRKGKVSLDVKGSLFGAYDERLQAEVARRWYAICEKYEYGERTGTVEIYFKLHNDGRISELAILNNTAGEVLGQYCKKAIDDSAPFDPFPDELRALLAQPNRDINFVFYY